MSRLAVCMLAAGLVTASAGADDPPAAMPKFKGFTALPQPVVGVVKKSKGDELTITTSEFSVKPSSSGRGRPSVSGKEVEHTFTFHEDALVRWERKPEQKDEKGRRKEPTPAEMKKLRSPAGAPGFAAGRDDLAAGQVVEVALLLPAKAKPADVVEQDYRIKWVVIKPAAERKPAEPKKDKK
jgi:hypothetical protein